MAHKQTALDMKPGSLPDIRTNKDGITFVMTPDTGDGEQLGEQLVVRCDSQGDVWISIQSKRSSP